MRDSMRDRILAAAVSVMRDRGLTGTTTREIARAAGVAEGSIYNHFANKSELIAASLASVTDGLHEALVRLAGRVGEGTVDGNLAELAEAEIAFFTDLLPLTGPALGDPALRDWLGHRRGVEVSTETPTDQAPGAGGPAQGGHGAAAAGVGGAAGTGSAASTGGLAGAGSSPGTGSAAGAVFGHAAVVGYLEAEQRTGRLATYARPPFLAATLIGACHHYAFVRLLTPPQAMAETTGMPADPAVYAEEIVRVVMMGHHPRRARPH
ncbi:helix-turn-helix domain-containing protein [Actinomadura sp. DC4]|uniref:TetR/AcrR family transcriptional regulator n=1 Tax=Actinomadura sp. DC4 TaxID=3055069 RepID=UPI0025B0D3BC|nr:helix-turn-helix domain-containing protein [Actinomadura sp. DC4]MDN3356767.1 helix-turn-helix domain-containing protein [Actinomadura sp. DC4]